MRCKAAKETQKNHREAQNVHREAWNDHKDQKKKDHKREITQDEVKSAKEMHNWQLRAE